MPINQTIIVNSISDTNDGDLSNGITTLREGIAAANASQGSTTIIFDLPDDSVISLTDTLDILGDLIIDASDVDGLEIKGDQSFDLILLGKDADVTLKNLTLTDGANGVKMGNSGSLSLEGTDINDSSEYAIAARNGNTIDISADSTFANNDAGAISLNSRNTVNAAGDLNGAIEVNDRNTVDIDGSLTGTVVGDDLNTISIGKDAVGDITLHRSNNLTVGDDIDGSLTAGDGNTISVADDIYEDATLGRKNTVTVGDRIGDDLTIKSKNTINVGGDIGDDISAGNWNELTIGGNV
ncbi:MAG: hypothetical protein F6K09_05425, partial [Merismopedia sp. SIO2A8]|nr:hypothetical protein [Merismopedia sp. SIO2A8]